MIILELHRWETFSSPAWVGFSWEGVCLTIPTSEWEALGRPDSLHFVASEKPLSVGRAGDVREAGAR